MSTNDQRMFDAILSAVKSLVPNYGVDADSKVVEFAVAGDPFNVIIDIKFLEDSGCYMIFSELGFKVPEENRLNYAAQICQINFEQLAIGSYDFNVVDGTTCFRLGQIYEDSLISEDTMKGTIRLVYDTVCKFNELLFNASRGALPTESAHDNAIDKTVEANTSNENDSDDFNDDSEE